ncbi:MAG: phosphodiester glycosidase family protein [Candidatus Hodarchaeota archaeon]
MLNLISFLKQKLYSIKNCYFDNFYGVDLRDYVHNILRYNYLMQLTYALCCFYQRMELNSSYNLISDSFIYTDIGFTIKKILFRKRHSIISHSMYLFIINPKFFKFEVILNDKPLRIKEWFNRYQPFMIINGGYYKDDYSPLGLVKCKEKIFGKYNRGLSGIIRISNDKLDMDWSEKMIKDHNLKDVEFILQTGPFIIQPYFRDGINSDNRKYDRRTVIAKDCFNNIIIVIFPNKSLSLYGVMNILKAFNLKVCLNLDGGTSMGCYISLIDSRFYLPSIKKIPYILAVFKK